MGQADQLMQTSIIGLLIIHILGKSINPGNGDLTYEETQRVSE